tara:strand:- start:470 stop:913 length:444 start_codon:yes stop_codon:yes gene_type:complete
MGNERNKRVAKAAGAATAVTTGAYALASADDRRKARAEKARRKRIENEKAQRKTKTKGMQTKLAKAKLEQLRDIKSKDLSVKERKIKNELMDRQKDIIKGNKPPSLAKAAAKVGLRTIPGVGAFLTAFSSKPAGQGSARFGPGSKKP